MDGATVAVGAWPQAGAAVVLLVAFGYVLRQWHLASERWQKERSELIQACKDQVESEHSRHAQMRADLDRAREREEYERELRREAEERLHRAGLRAHDQ